MNDLENVMVLLRDYVQVMQDFSILTDLQQKILLLNSKKCVFSKVHEAFFNYVADPIQSPENIIYLLDTCSSELEGLAIKQSIQASVTIVCLEGLTRRSLKYLSGPWETLVWIIVKYTASIRANTSYGSALDYFRVRGQDVTDWIIKFTSQKLCPNPCLRLEIFRFIELFRFKYFHYSVDDHKSFRDNVIDTIFELSDNNASLTFDKVPNFGPVDLHDLIEYNAIDMGSIIKDYDLDLKKTEIVVAILKLTKNLALLVKERYQRLNNDELNGQARLKYQLLSCLSFCGLIDINFGLDCFLYLIKDVGKNYFILNYVIEAVDTITQVSLSFPNEDGLHDSVTRRKKSLFQRFFKEYVNRLPKFQNLQEMHGGISPAAEYCLRYLQNNVMDQYNEIEYVHKSYASDQNYERFDDSEENDSTMAFSDEVTSDEDDILQ